MATATTKTPNRFEVLAGIDFADHVELKNGLKYVSWAWAWSEFKKKYPDSVYDIVRREDGVNYFNDGKTCWVETIVTLVDGDYSLSLKQQLPIMDFKNKSIPMNAITSMDVNKAIQRCLVKNLAMFGLGLYIYAGEDLPEETTEAVADLKEEIGKELTRIGAGKTREEQMKIIDGYIKPICGGSYKVISDTKKLNKLLEELKKI